MELGLPDLRSGPFQRLAEALQQVPFNHLFATSVIDGLASGAVWTDSESSPAWVHIVHPYGMSLLVVLDADADDGPLLDHLNEWRYQRGGLWLQVHPQAFAARLDRMLDAEQMALQPHPTRVRRFVRANFKFDPALYASRRPRGSGCGVTLRPMTEAEFAMPDITVSPHMFWRDANQFLSHGGGWCLGDGDLVSAIGFTSFRIGARLELGVETRPQYRGKGHARLACAALIDQCLQSGLEPVWSCRKENAGSYQLAQSLGFVPTFEGAYYHLPRLI
jgi:RimJ/RimL family protein N-acetyltransferase